MVTKHTPGPWLAAAAPSSVVGWPVVGQQGRAVASVHCMMQRPAHVPEAEFQAYRDECEANARLIGAAPTMAEALREAERFMAYFAGETDRTFEGPGTPRSCLAMIREAIGKAEGLS